MSFLIYARTIITNNATTLLMHYTLFFVVILEFTRPIQIIKDVVMQIMYIPLSSIELLFDCLKYQDHGYEHILFLQLYG